MEELVKLGSFTLTVPVHKSHLLSFFMDQPDSFKWLDYNAAVNPLHCKSVYLNFKNKDEEPWKD